MSSEGGTDAAAAAATAAGPSSAPAVFKKRSKAGARQSHRVAKILLGDGPAAPEADEDTKAAALQSGGQRNGQGGDKDQDEEYEDGEGISVADLVALRNLQRKPTGIELDKLNQGVKKKRKKSGRDKAGMTDEDRWKEQMEQGGLVKPEKMRGRGARDDEDDDDEEDDAKTLNRSRRLVRQDNFQGETNVIDVDKHMMTYIEEEMRKRRAAVGGSPIDASASTASHLSSDVKAVLSNPEDELYKVAEKYTRLQQEARSAATASNLIQNRARPDDEDGEGSVGLSSAMLSGIPEVELGMDSRLKNIEDTEKAKRAMLEARKQGRVDTSDMLLANARFFNSRRDAQSDAQALASARAAASGSPMPSPLPSNRSGQQSSSASSSGPAGHKRGAAGDRREMATDDVVMQRFKKRQMNGMKR